MTHTGIILSQSHSIYALCPADSRTTLLTGRVSGKMIHHAASPADFPAVGDRVQFEWDGHSENVVILGINARHSVLDRIGDPITGTRQLIAANVDILILCMSLNQNFSLNRAERYVAAALAGHVKPVIVLTKADLCPDAQAHLEETRAAFPGTIVMLNSASSMDAVPALRSLLAENKTLVFAGSSGVGKSTLINAVLDTDAMRTSAIRESDGRGRHTTTHREMHFTPWGGAVIDTPGMRAFALDSADVEGTFVDLAELAQKCRFSDCTHRSEPGCAIRQALEEGLITARQVNSFIRLSQESARRAAIAKKRSRK